MFWKIYDNIGNIIEIVEGNENDIFQYIST